MHDEPEEADVYAVIDAKSKVAISSVLIATQDEILVREHLYIFIIIIFIYNLWFICLFNVFLGTNVGHQDEVEWLIGLIRADLALPKEEEAKDKKKEDSDDEMKDDEDKDEKVKTGPSRLNTKLACKLVSQQLERIQFKFYMT